MLEIFRRGYPRVRLIVREHFTAILADERARMQQGSLKNDTAPFARRGDDLHVLRLILALADSILARFQ